MPKEFTLDLPCHLAPNELLEKGREAAVLAQQIARLELRKKAVAKELKAEIEQAAERLSELHRQIRERTETRAVNCVEVNDFRENSVKVVRLDDRTVVRERAMTADERQLELTPRASEVAEEASGVFDD